MANRKADEHLVRVLTAAFKNTHSEFYRLQMHGPWTEEDGNL